MLTVKIVEYGKNGPIVYHISLWIFFNRLSELAYIFFFSLVQYSTVNPSPVFLGQILIEVSTILKITMYNQ